MFKARGTRVIDVMGLGGLSEDPTPDYPTPTPTPTPTPLGGSGLEKPSKSATSAPQDWQSFATALVQNVTAHGELHRLRGTQSPAPAGKSRQDGNSDVTPRDDVTTERYVSPLGDLDYSTGELGTVLGMGMPTLPANFLDRYRAAEAGDLVALAEMRDIGDRVPAHLIVAFHELVEDLLANGAQAAYR